MIVPPNPTLDVQAITHVAEADTTHAPSPPVRVAGLDTGRLFIGALGLIGAIAWR